MRPSIPPLTSARFIAALAVVIFHYDKKLQIFPPCLTTFGYEAVTFFFVLSGFILTYTHAQPSGLNVSLARFASNRLIRIVPAYFLALLVGAPFFFAALAKTGQFSPEGLLVPLMLQSWWPPAALLWNSPAWSLSNEIFFYAVYPLIWAVLRRMPPIHSLLASLALIVSVTVLRMVPVSHEAAWHNFYAYFPLLNLPQFVLGIALAQLFLSVGPANQSSLLFFVSSAALAFTIALKPDHPWLASDAWLCAVFGLLIYTLAGTRGATLRCLSARWLLVLGEASYAIYILHSPLWMWWDRIVRVELGLELSAGIDFAAYLSCVILVCIAVVYLIEKPVRRTPRQKSRTQTL